MHFKTISIDKEEYSALFQASKYSTDSDTRIYSRSNPFHLKGIPFRVYAFFSPLRKSARYPNDATFNFKLVSSDASAAPQNYGIFLEVTTIAMESNKTEVHALTQRIHLNGRDAQSLLFMRMRDCNGDATLTLKVQFHFITAFPLTSPLMNCMRPSPEETPLFKFFNCKLFSDVTFSFNDGKNLMHANKQIISEECAFFEKMLGEAWQDSMKKDQPIAISNWSKEVFGVCILHLYTGWIPGTPLPKLVAEKLGFPHLILDAHSLTELMTIAHMLELDLLTYSASSEAKVQIELALKETTLELAKKEIEVLKMPSHEQTTSFE